MSSNLRVNNIFPSVGTNVAIGTAGGSITLTGSVTGANLNFTGITTLSGITTVTGETLFTRQLSVSGVTTLSGITTVTGETLFTRQLIVSGVTTTSSLSINGTVSPSPNGSINITGIADTTRYTATGTSNGYPDAYKALYLRNNSGSDGAGCLMVMSANNSGGYYNWWYLGSIATADGNRAGNFVIGSRNSGANYSERLRIDSSGNVGVGSTQPASKLDVDGEITIRRTASGGEEGGQVNFARASDNAVAWNIDAFGSTSTPTLRFIDSIAAVSRAEIDSSGNFTVKSGNLVMGTAGKGIDFSATANSSGTMTSELLNDYEEGIFTPTLTGASVAGTTSYTRQDGIYTKIGRQVTVSVFMQISSATGSGTIRLGGLPFTIGSYYSQGSVMVGGYNWSGGTYLNLVAPPTGNYFDVYYSGDDIGWAIQSVVNESQDWLYTVTYNV